MENMNMEHAAHDTNKSTKYSNIMYKKFYIMVPIMFVGMFLVMYSMVDKANNVVFNINNVYMTLLMVAIMVLIELVIMKAMYTNKKNNAIIIVVTIIIGFISWFGIRTQWLVEDKEFIKGMIPHHAAALQMAKESTLTDPELITLQKNILATQAQEIELMKRKLQELKNK